jgi:hypothetical protein
VEKPSKEKIQSKTLPKNETKKPKKEPSKPKEPEIMEPEEIQIKEPPKEESPKPPKETLSTEQVLRELEVQNDIVGNQVVDTDIPDDVSLKSDDPDEEQDINSLELQF